jgi:hypothetical protein
VLPLQFGGAEFITIQAAAELQIISDAEKQGIVSFNCGKRGGLFHTDVNVFSPSSMLTDLKLEVNSTFGGGNYGSTSSAMQFDYYKNIVLGRRISGGDHEVEWVQQDRSYAMTRFAIEHDEINLGETGKLSITILFGFSPKLPFPIEYSEFRQVVALAKSLEFLKPNTEWAPSQLGWELRSCRITLAPPHFRWISGPKLDAWCRPWSAWLRMPANPTLRWMFCGLEWRTLRF